MSDPILYDPRIDAKYVVWHEDPNLEALVNDIMQKVKPQRFVETGTHMGWTLMYMAKHYSRLPIYSAEIDERYYINSRHNCDPYPHITLYHMSSLDFLQLIYVTLSVGLSFFWLDAHWWNPVPLREECKIISTLDKYIILIDDFACDNPRFGGDVFDGQENNIHYVKDILGNRYYRPNYEALPPYHKGYGLFIKGVDYQPPATMRLETVE